MCGIGAVFTRPEWRGRGHASALIERMLDDARRQGALMAGLFSEIGEPFYERLGYVARGPLFLDAGIEHRDMDLWFEPREAHPAGG